MNQQQRIAYANPMRSSEDGPLGRPHFTREGRLRVGLSANF